VKRRSWSVNTCRSPSKSSIVPEALRPCSNPFHDSL
jgi:hypothetical protein